MATQRLKRCSMTVFGIAKGISQRTNRSAQHGSATIELICLDTHWRGASNIRNDPVCSTMCVMKLSKIGRKGMMKKISEAGPVVGTIFGLAVKGKQTLPWPLNAIIDKVLFARVKQATGGRLRLAVCGGGSTD